LETEPVITDDTRDNPADDLINKCLNIDNPKSFFMFAGAGSGKTRSLVKALNYINSSVGTTLLQSGRKVAVITYTNAASDEIKQRAKYNPLFEISTIHSFAWTLISAHTVDIREWLKTELIEKIGDLQQKQARSKSTTTKTYLERAKKIEKHTQRLRFLDTANKFIYNPDGLNLEDNALDHSEVIKIISCFLESKPTFKSILIDKYPIVLIDESQDTNKHLMTALINVQQENKSNFTLGLFGDTMQRIYFDGKDNLVESIPDDWEKPLKVMNHRSKKRIVDLCNDIRKEVDGIRQLSRADKQGGIIRLFITNSDDAYTCEQAIRVIMKEVSSDEKWDNIENVKCLTLEHKMAASRLGFKSFYEPLNDVSSYRQGLSKGNLVVIGLFTHILIPLKKASIECDQFEVMRIIRDYSTLFRDYKLSLTPTMIQELNVAVEQLVSKLLDETSTCKDLLNIVYVNKIFPVHKDLQRIIEDFPDSEDDDYDKFKSLRNALESSFSEVQKYYDYVQGNASFDTHQGVKGLEFDRVQVIIDDKESRGSWFSYEKLFGIKQKTDSEKKNELEGKETVLDRTRRLLYVTCSRAQESLAIVLYTSDVEKAYASILGTELFDESEIIKMAT